MANWLEAAGNANCFPTCGPLGTDPEAFLTTTVWLHSLSKKEGKSIVLENVTRYVFLSHCRPSPYDVSAQVEIELAT